MSASPYHDASSSDGDAASGRGVPRGTGAHALRAVDGADHRSGRADDLRPDRTQNRSLHTPDEAPVRRFEQTAVAPLPELTAAGAGLAVGVIVSAAAVIDRLLSPGLGILFGFVFVLASVYAALRMCWRDSWAALALPPLVFVSAAGVSALFSSSASGGRISRSSAEIAAAVLGHPIYLLSGTILAGLCLAYRARVE